MLVISNYKVTKELTEHLFAWRHLWITPLYLRRIVTWNILVFRACRRQAYTLYSCRDKKSTLSLSLSLSLFFFILLLFGFLNCVPPLVHLRASFYWKHDFLPLNFNEMNNFKQLGPTRAQSIKIFHLHNIYWQRLIVRTFG